ncbi:N-acetyltransferase [bacterium D16-50]|nr:N-acetyltransferase [bacterium D16-50]
MNVYEKCPTYENHRFLLRFTEMEDSEDLLEVYADKNALPFFNSDNCDGDNFYYPSIERMREANRFWRTSYENKWFVRWSIIDKAAAKAVGTVELCLRVSDDAFDGAGVLRIDVRSDYEQEESLTCIGSLIVPNAFGLFNCTKLITKAPIYAVERIKAIQKLGFRKSPHLLIGKDGYPYSGYWIAEHK